MKCIIIIIIHSLLYYINLNITTIIKLDSIVMVKWLFSLFSCFKLLLQLNLIQDISEILVNLSFYGFHWTLIFSWSEMKYFCIYLHGWLLYKTYTYPVQLIDYKIYSVYNSNNRKYTPRIEDVFKKKLY